MEKRLDSTLNFSGEISSLNLKGMTSDDLKLRKHPYGANVIIADPVYGYSNSYPLRVLPILFKSNYRTGRFETPGEQGVVMTKGTIVSLVTVNTDSVAASGIEPSGLTKFNDLYDASVFTALVPANGGEDVAIPYDSNNADLDIIATGNTSGYLNIKGNKPYGILVDMVYQDDEGRYLNSSFRDLVTPLVKGVVKVPFVNVDLVSGFGTYDTKATTPYGEVYKDFQFLMLNSASDSGSLIKSDKFGKFVIQSDDVNATKTVQTVGKLQGLDIRFPKSLDAMVQHYPGIALQGVETDGIPSSLYIFVGRILKKLGLAYTKTAIAAAIAAGKFGFAIIEFDLR